MHSGGRRARPRMTVERLSREYVCVQGAPLIHSVDTAIFGLRYFTRCMACTFCHDGCCDHGVDIDLANRDRLLALGEDFSSRVAAPKAEWFTGGRCRRPGVSLRPLCAHGRAQRKMRVPFGRARLRHPCLCTGERARLSRDQAAGLDAVPRRPSTTACWDRAARSRTARLSARAMGRGVRRRAGRTRILFRRGLRRRARCATPPPRVRRVRGRSGARAPR